MEMLTRLRFCREHLLSIYYACALQPLAPLNVVQSIPMLIDLARSRRWVEVFLSVATLALLLAPNTVLRLAGFSLAVSLGCLVTRGVEMSVGEVIARFLLMGLATYISAMNGVLYVHAFADYLSEWVRGSGSSLAPLYVVYVVVSEVSDVSKQLSFRACRYLSDPSVAAALLFTILLIAAAALLGMGSDALANKFAEMAYFSLVAAVLVQLYQIARGRGGAEASR